MRRQSDRFRESRERRDKANAELERLLLEELWEDRQSQMHIPPVVVPPAVVPPAHPAVVSAESEPSARGLSTQAKQVITIVATAVALALVGALKGMGATTTHEIPSSTQPGP